MRVCFIFGKGIDGCGVSRGAIIFEKWLRANGHDTFIIDFDNDQAMMRAARTGFIGPVTRIPKELADAPQSVIDDVSSADVAIYHSYPTRKQPAFVERFRRFVEKVNGPIQVMHDHGISTNTINMVPQAGEIFAHADVLAVQSMDGLSAEAYTKMDPGLKGRVLENQIWIDPTSLDSFRKPFDERQKHFVYMGRMSPLKDPAMVCRVEPHLPESWRLSLIGCEYSISSIASKIPGMAPYSEEFLQKIHTYRQNSKGEYKIIKKGAPENVPCRIKAYDSYQYAWGMGQLGSSIASWCGYALSNPENYGTRMEYTVIESMLLSLPVINKRFAENARSPEGKLWGEYYGPLVAGYGDEVALANELVRIAKDKAEWESRTAACRELVAKFNDAETLAAKFWDTIIGLGKREKTEPMLLIERWFPMVREYRADGEVILSTASCALHGIPAVMEPEGKMRKVSGL